MPTLRTAFRMPTPAAARRALMFMLPKPIARAFWDLAKSSVSARAAPTVSLSASPQAERNSFSAVWYPAIFSSPIPINCLCNPCMPVTLPFESFFAEKSSVGYYF